MDWYENYLNTFAQTPHDMWKGLNQASLDTAWNDTTQIRTIKEQVYPFADEYIDYEVWVDSVADINVNTSKDITDFIKVLFKDNSRTVNHRGQKYLYDPNGNNSWQTYLCYDCIQPLSQVAESKMVRCNNYLKWIDRDTGEILKEPCFIGYELSSYSNKVSKEGIIEDRKLVCMIQGNIGTSKFKTNQRFIIGHKSAFKILQVNSYMMEDINTEECPLLVMYIQWDSLLPSDDLEHNIADIYNDTYTIEINSGDIENVNGYSDTLTASVTLNGEIIDADLIWSSDNENVVKVDNDGTYTIVGEIGQTANIICNLGKQSYTPIQSQISVTVVADGVSNYVIKVTPIITEITELSTETLVGVVYKDGDKTDAVVTCTPSWVDDNYYTLTEIDTNTFELYNAHKSKQPLMLTFSADNCENVEFTIKLKSLF